MKLASWNVNSIKTRLPNVLGWIEKAQPDVLLLQELKCMNENFPEKEFRDAGYHAAVHGQKSWNGVAILSKTKPEKVRPGLPGDDGDAQSRYIEATVRGIRVASVYLPNGNPVDSEKYAYKLQWMDRLIAHARGLLAEQRPAILAGDFNVIPEARDAQNPGEWKNDALFLLESRKKFRALLFAGYTDAFRVFNNEGGHYTFWDYQAASWERNNGIRIDHILCTPQAADALESCTIDAGPRGEEKASDHTPIVGEFRA